MKAVFSLVLLFLSCFPSIEALAEEVTSLRRGGGGSSVSCQAQRVDDSLRVTISGGMLNDMGSVLFSTNVLGEPHAWNCVSEFGAMGLPTWFDWRCPPGGVTEFSVPLPSGSVAPGAELSVVFSPASSSQTITCGTSS